MYMHPFMNLSKSNIVSDHQTIVVIMVEIKHIILDFDVFKNGFIFKTRL